MAATVKPTDTIKRNVQLTGLRDIMFDRYAGDNNTKLEPQQKLYVVDGVIGLPAANITSFFTGHNTNSAPKRLRDKRKYKDIANACLSFVEIAPMHIPFLRDGKPVHFGKLVDDLDPESKVFVHRTVARLDKGVPNPKVRPVLPMPWALEFELTIRPNKEIKEEEVRNLLVEGGHALGLGTYRGLYGKFEVTAWE